MKKKIVIVFLILIVFFIGYFGVIKHGFTYYTGIGTKYSYLEAKEASNDSILTIYLQNLYEYILIPEQDSLDLKYGFRTMYVEDNVSISVIMLYNAVIKKELKRRLGPKWDEYLFKLDSLYKSNQTLLYYQQTQLGRR